LVGYAIAVQLESASASTMLNESGLWSADAIERQLAHVENNDECRAYARGEHWDERVKMMKWWADYLDSLKSVGNVVQIGRKLAYTRGSGA
jgi:hypothetical protein